MPQALGPIVIGLKTIGFSGLGLAIAKGVVTLGLTFGLSSIVSAVFRPSGPKPSDGQQSSRGSVEGRKRHYGHVHTSGQESFFESRDGTLAYVLTLGTGEEDGTILEHRLGNVPVTVDGSGNVTSGDYDSNVHIYTRRGTADQTAIAQLTAKFPEWTSDHRQRGCAHAAVICDPVEQEDFAKVYNNRVPAYTQVRKGVVVYDPRADDTAVIGHDGNGDPVYGSGPQRLNDRSTWAWRDNGPLVIADYFAHEDGYGGGYDNVNWTNIAQEADIADEIVTTKGGASIARWRIWGSYDLASSERKAVLADMMRAIDGFPWQDADGLFNLKCGRWEEPTLVIPDDHIIAMSTTQGPDASERASAIKMLYTEQATGYREEESALTPVPDATEGPNTQPTAIPAYMIPHHNQAMRVGKRTAAMRSPERWRFQLKLNLFGLNLFGQRFCRIESASFGVSGWFELVSPAELVIGDGEMAVTASVAQVAPEDWDFDAATEEGTPPGSSGSSAGTPSVPALAGLSLATQQVALSSGYGVQIVATWTAPARLGLDAQLQFRAVDGDWIAMAVESTGRTAVSGPVSSGTPYEVRGRYRTIGGLVSDWSATETITPSADNVLAPPTGLYAVGDVGEAGIYFTIPTSPALDHVKIYGADSDSFGSAVQIGADITGPAGVQASITDTGLSAGTRYYWARSFDSEGASSTLVGPVQATIS